MEREVLWNKYLFIVQKRIRYYLGERKRITSSIPSSLREEMEEEWSQVLKEEDFGRSRKFSKQELEFLELVWQQEVELHTGRSELGREVAMDISYIDTYIADRSFFQNKTEEDLIQEEIDKMKRDEVFQQLLHRVLFLAKRDLTSIQHQILELRLRGLSYQEIAEERCVNYTAIAHAIGGIMVKTTDGKTKHGGIMKKLKLICQNDTECQLLLAELYNLRG